MTNYLRKNSIHVCKFTNNVFFPHGALFSFGDDYFNPECLPKKVASTIYHQLPKMLKIGIKLNNWPFNLIKEPVRIQALLYCI